MSESDENVEPAQEGTADLIDLSVEELKARLARAEDRIVWIQELAAVLNNLGGPDEILDVLGDRIARILDAERVFIFLVEENQNFVSTLVPVGSGFREVRVRVGEGIPGVVARTGQSVNLKDATRDARHSSSLDSDLGVVTRSVLCQPMRDKEQRLVGVIQVGNRRSGWFTVDDEALLSALTSTVSIVIDNARLYVNALDRNMELAGLQQRLEDRVQRLDLLYDLQRRINEADDFHGVAEAIAVGAAETIGASGCAITVYVDREVEEYAFMRDPLRGVYVSVRRSWDTSFRDEAVTTGRAILVGQPSGAFQEPGAPGEPAREVAVESLCVVPLEGEVGAIGTIEVVNRRGFDDSGRRRPFDDEDRKLLSLLAAQFGGVVARTLRREVEQRNAQLAAIGRMLSGVVHDLRTPLTIVSGNVQLMERADDRERRHALGGTVLAQVDHINQMMRELLAYARGELRLYLRSVSLAALVDELRDQLSLEFADSGVALVVEATSGENVRIDDGKVRRVLFNLARNAREAMPDGGQYHIVFSLVGDALVIRCMDDGPGIPDAVRHRVFDAFVSSRTGRDNSGLGLAIVKRLVEEHGGTVSFASNAGRGTVFELTIPNAREGTADG